MRFYNESKLHMAASYMFQMQEEENKNVLRSVYLRVRRVVSDAERRHALTGW